MKNCFILLAPFLFLSCSEKNIIEHPDFDSSREFMSIYSIELTDTATILRGSAYHLPNYWVSISSKTTLKGKQTDNTYKLLSSPEYELDKEIFMPESGTKPFTLLFEPVDKEDTEVDLVEDDRIDIAGLKLTPRKGKYHMKIRGTVIGDSLMNRIMLEPFDSDSRVNKWISIPVINGKFEYELITDRQDPYEIKFYKEWSEGAWRKFEFLADNGDINITCDFNDIYRYTYSSTSTINQALLKYDQETKNLFDYKSFHDQIDSLRKINQLYTPEIEDLHKRAKKEADENQNYGLFNELNEKINSSTRDAFTPEGKFIYAKIDSISVLSKQRLMDYLNQENPTMANYFKLARPIFYHYDDNFDDIQDFIDLYNNKYSKLFTDNLLTEKIQLKIGSSILKAGGNFIDFTAPDLQGKEHTLSELIEGKIAIIDLWASWCGPCRRHSMEIIPIYEEYKNKGFTVVGIARENNNTRAMEKAIDQDGYPWINLVELNDKGKIWQKYGAGNGGGIIIMVDRDGKVIAVNPSQEEIRKKLDKMISHIQYTERTQSVEL